MRIIFLETFHMAFADLQFSAREKTRRKLLVGAVLGPAQHERVDITRIVGVELLLNDSFGRRRIAIQVQAFLQE